jgi:hypothetical protein
MDIQNIDIYLERLGSRYRIETRECERVLVRSVDRRHDIVIRGFDNALPYPRMDVHVWSTFPVRIILARFLGLRNEMELLEMLWHIDREFLDSMPQSNGPAVRQPDRADWSRTSHRET